MATLPIFGAGNYENILKAISQGTISYPAWMYCRDQKKLGFVERDGSFVLMKGDNKEQIVYLDKLPEISEGDTEFYMLLVHFATNLMVQSLSYLVQTTQQNLKH